MIRRILERADGFIPSAVSRIRDLAPNRGLNIPEAYFACREFTNGLILGYIWQNPSKAQIAYLLAAAIKNAGRR
jgi:hypothetical protein